LTFPGVSFIFLLIERRSWRPK